MTNPSGGLGWLLHALSHSLLLRHPLFSVGLSVLGALSSPALLHPYLSFTGSNEKLDSLLPLPRFYA